MGLYFMRKYLNRDLRKMMKPVVKVSGGKLSEGGGIAGAKALRGSKLGVFKEP